MERRNPTTMIKLQSSNSGELIIRSTIHRHFTPMNWPKCSRYKSKSEGGCCRYCDSCVVRSDPCAPLDDGFIFSHLNWKFTERIKRGSVRGNDCVSSCRNVRHSPWHCLSSLAERYARRASTRDKLKRGFCSRALSLPRFPLWGRMSDSVCHSTTRVYLLLSLSFSLVAHLYARVCTKFQNI